MENGEPVPLLIAAGGGGKAYLEDPESSLDQIFLEQYENDTSASGVNGKSGAAGTVFLQHSPLQNLLNEILFCQPVRLRCIPSTTASTLLGRLSTRF